MNRGCRCFSWGALPNLDHVHLADASASVGECFRCRGVWMNLELLLHLRLILLNRRVLRLYVLLRLRSWVGRRGWQHVVLVLRAASSLYHWVIFLELMQLPTIA